MYEHSNEFFRFVSLKKDCDFKLFSTNFQSTAENFLKTLKRDATKAPKELKTLKLLNDLLIQAKSKNSLEAFLIEIEKSGLLDLVEGL